MKIAVVRTGGKQYLVKENDEIVVDRLSAKAKDKVEIETLAVFDESGSEFELGKPTTKAKVKGEVIDQLKGDKIRVARFKSKVRYRKVKGFRARLTKIKILSIKS